MASTRSSRKQRTLASPMQARAAAAPSITLHIKGGLLMAFGPEGDPIPPGLVKAICAEAGLDRLRLRHGVTVDHQRALAVLEAQQLGRLSKKPSNRWIESLLGLAGSFEPTPDELLAAEPAGNFPTGLETPPQSR